MFGTIAEAFRISFFQFLFPWKLSILNWLRSSQSVLSQYRMDVARYRPLNRGERRGQNFHGFSQWNKSSSALDRDADADVLDNKVKSGGRYWSAKNAAIERHKNFKRVRIGFSRNTSDTLLDDFIPLSDVQTSSNIEESWEDEVLRKTREFNKLTREHPHDEKAWLAFAEFQDKVAAMQPQKGARLQTLEKKISILEKAAELNPENEELLLYLLKTYQNRDNIDVVISRWEKILLQNSGSYRLWREFLHLMQGEFSKFKVSDMRQMYAHAIQALSAACNQHIRQVLKSNVYLFSGHHPNFHILLFTEVFTPSASMR